MKKKLMAISCLCIASMFAFGACGGGTDSTPSGGQSSGNEPSGIELLDLGIDEAYLPDLENIETQQGKIDVVILFDGTEKGWEAVAKEYQRIHNDAVVVKLDTQYTSGTYADKLNSQFGANDNDWDIVQGNLAAGTSVQRYCLNMQSAIDLANPYAGKDMAWGDVLMTDAYTSDKTGGNASVYLMNSEGLQTAWFVNTVAMEEAGVTEMPTTWDELMDLCGKMQDAGYSNPLGISLEKDSVTATQFTWLLRVYGDYYYRSEYQNIMEEANYEVDLGDENPEEKQGFKYSWTKLFNSILEESSVNYVGGTSAKFQDFIGQFGKMANYLPTDAGTLSFSQMRTNFRSQGKGKDSPQILLDYLGSGLNFENSTGFEMDFFDYPVMESIYIAEGTLLRDVGGNGGYLSIVKQDKAQTELSLDFMKFFMSPYGQSVYYKGLSEANAAPKGMTTVINDLVAVPEKWESFFATEKVKFTGLSDSNPYITYFIRGLSEKPVTAENITSYWKGYLLGVGNQQSFKDNEAAFGVAWQDDMMKDWATFCEEQSWNTNCYKYPGEDTSYGG